MTYLCFVDKSAGESHSFVDGMLKKIVVHKYPGSRIFYYAAVARGGKAKGKCGSACSPFKRRGIGRLLHPLWSVLVVRSELVATSRVRVFIRNEFIILLLLCMYRFLSGSKFEVYFQSSFPHELYSGSVVSRFGARLILRSCLPRVDGAFVVSELARDRVYSYGVPDSVPIHVIPLCVDFDAHPSLGRERLGARSFVYIGTFARARGLDVLVAALMELVTLVGNRCELTLYGGGREQYLSAYPHMANTVDFLEAKGPLKFGGTVSRETIPSILALSDIGINYVPSKRGYLESSSTKLGEYLACGLPVISTSSIPYHEYIHSLGEVGWLTEAESSASLAGLMLKVLRMSSEDLDRMSATAVRIARERLHYGAYSEIF